MSRSHERHRSIRRVLEGGVYVSERVVNSAAGNVSLGHSTLRLLESLDRMRTKPLDRDFGCRKEAIVLNNNQLLPWNFHVKVLEIVLAGTADFDNFHRHSDEECRTYQSSTPVPFLQRNCVIESTIECSPGRHSAGVVKMRVSIVIRFYNEKDTL